MANGRVLAFYITICCIAFVASKVVISVLLYKRWLRKRRIIEEGFAGGKLVLFRSLTTAQALPSKAFLKKTMRLTSKDIIGSGGYGTVYKLLIDGGAAAFAVKRLSRGSADRDRGFERELEAMGDIKHRNILTLHGYYTTPQFNLLIYDLMPNGSLDAFLHGTFQIPNWILEREREGYDSLESNSGLGGVMAQGRGRRGSLWTGRRGTR